VKDYHINVFWSEEDGCYVADIPDLRTYVTGRQMPKDDFWYPFLQHGAGSGQSYVFGSQCDDDRGMALAGVAWAGSQGRSLRSTSSPRITFGQDVLASVTGSL